MTTSLFNADSYAADFVESLKTGETEKSNKIIIHNNNDENALKSRDVHDLLAGSILPSMDAGAASNISIDSQLSEPKWGPLGAQFLPTGTAKKINDYEKDFAARFFASPGNTLDPVYPPLVAKGFCTFDPAVGYTSRMSSLDSFVNLMYPGATNGFQSVDIVNNLFNNFGDFLPMKSLDRQLIEEPTQDTSKTTTKKKRQTKKETKSQPKRKTQTTKVKTNKPKKTTTKKEESPKEYITNYRDNDVLRGRGGRSNHHPGNQIYLEKVKEMRQTYINSEKHEKTKVAQSIVDSIRIEHGGRFVEFDEDAQKWYVVTNLIARRKVSQALREENTPEARATKREKYPKTK